MEDGVTVLKYPHYKSDNAMEALLEEAARHDHLGLHINLVAFKAVHPDGLLFEYCEQGSLYEHIIGHVPIRNTRKIAIGAQVVSGLAHLHQRNYIHCDLNVHNVFITSGGIAKIGDMQGQLYRPDGTIDLPTMSQENAKSRHPEAGDDEFSVKTDIFALGTLLYELWHEAAPFPDLNEQTQEEEIKVRYANGEWPVNVARADPIDMIILRCWTSAYNDVNEILADMESLPENVGK
ncbi:hypothetical protein DOTSEDRAFT_75919 [Dothistroma septosporum NZE10]|uniref:Protein kinase domain-containing protein n=1 Tax=Dothistroma septosporum (strain NZE10 / CBS 128990) TaxID=675120 RepID=N1PEL1_DOTSN|nr:hypothetical protein DOTSEDRAFT_75919 [Dothistroma septosporum NZE10]